MTKEEFLELVGAKWEEIEKHKVIVFMITRKDSTYYGLNLVVKV